MVSVPARRKPKRVRAPEQVESTKSRYQLPWLKRMAIEALLHNSTVKEAAEAMQRVGFDVKANNLSQWRRQPEFMRAFKAREAEIVAGVTKETVVLNAHRLMEHALEPQPIVNRKTGEVVGYERQVGHALTANEQLGKATGAFARDDAARTVVVIDIDFSGRKTPVQERVIDADFSEVTVDDSWLE